MSQKGIVLNHLQKNGKITSWEAIQKYRITRLSDVIFKLRKDGYGIITISKRSKKGKPFAEYVLRKDDDNV